MVLYFRQEEEETTTAATTTGYRDSFWNFSVGYFSHFNESDHGSLQEDGPGGSELPGLRHPRSDPECQAQVPPGQR